MTQDPAAPERRDLSQSADTTVDGGVLRQALAAYEAGQYRRAELILRQVVEQRPGHGWAWHLRGLAALLSDNPGHAAACLVRAVDCDKANARYCAALAEALARLGRDADAVVLWQRARDIEPDNPEWRAGTARCFARQGRYAEALPHFRAAVQTNPDDGVLRTAFGHALQRSGDAAAAAAQYRAALAGDPLLHEARLNLAGALRDLGDHEAAVDHCHLMLAHQPRSVIALNNLGAALCNLGRHAEAIRHLRDALQYEPDNFTTLHNLGVALGAGEEAEAFLRKALILRPDSADAHRSLANLLRTAGQIDDAAQHYREVIDRMPRDFRSYGNLGLALLNLNRPFDAIAVYEKALALGPERSDIRMSLGIAQLLVGDLAAGWANYEARWQADGTARWRPVLDLPLWQRIENAPKTAPTILIHAEQGFGDTLHFCRYLPRVAATGARVVFECQPSLAGLMRTLPMPTPKSDFRVIAPSDPAPDADAHAPLLSLPHLFGTTLATIPADVPYLSAPTEKTMAWAGEIPPRAASGRLHVGLVWSGNPERQDDRLRSCPAEALAPLLELDDVRFYGLGKGAPRLPDAPVIDLGPQLTDFGDTAAVMEMLDLVISVDTAAAHLAGALGRPVWVMLGYAADWRYLLDRDDSPWYPTMRLFRQTAPGDWLSVTRRIAGLLRESRLRR